MVDKKRRELVSAREIALRRIGFVLQHSPCSCCYVLHIHTATNLRNEPEYPSAQAMVPSERCSELDYERYSEKSKWPHSPMGLTPSAHDSQFVALRPPLLAQKIG